MKEINSITLEIVANSITSIAEQMGVILSKTGYSTNIKERKDQKKNILKKEFETLNNFVRVEHSIIDFQKILEM